MKTVEFKKFLKVRQSGLRVGWQGRKQAQWNSNYCKGDLKLSVKRGWIISTVLVFVDGTRHQIIAECE